jgi:hypothetical protein
MKSNSTTAIGASSAIAVPILDKELSLGYGPENHPGLQ